jgi:uncharacterized protein (DUF362 family)
MSSIDRRQFLERMLALGGGALATAALLSLVSCSKETTPEPSDNTTPLPPPGDAYLAVAKGGNPTDLVRYSVNAIGGIDRFVKPGNDVIIKPNICGAHSPESAETTNPEVVGALVALCVGAGAKRVRVMDRNFSHPQYTKESYSSSGIAAAVKAAGREMEVMSTMGFQETPIPDGQKITSCRVYQDILKADVLINVPIAKRHDLPVLSLGMKNLLGTVDNPSSYHAELAERLTDLTSLVRPDLTVVDAIRLGKADGKLSDVKRMNTVIASHDIVAAGAYAATLFGLTGSDLPVEVAGAKRGLGTLDLSSIKVKEIAL